MEFWKDDELHRRWRCINENSKKTWTERLKLVPRAKILPVKF